MTEQKRKKLNKLQELLPEGLLADAAWLDKKGYSSSLRSQYVSAGWLNQPTRGVFRRSRGALQWEQAIISLQRHLLSDAVPIVGGRTALELHNYAHYLPQESKEVFLYGHKAVPGWLKHLPLDVVFVCRNDKKLFRNDPVTLGIEGIACKDWTLTLSTPERAVLQLLDELPDHESFHQVDMLFEGLSQLRPHRLQKLLKDCKSIKVKRLFFFFADRHGHAWVKYLDKNNIGGLGKGKRLIARGGKLDPVYEITVPEEMLNVLR